MSIQSTQTTSTKPLLKAPHAVRKAFHYHFVTHTALFVINASLINIGISLSSKLITTIFTIGSIISLNQVLSGIGGYINNRSVNLKTYQDNVEKTSFIQFEILKQCVHFTSCAMITLFAIYVLTTGSTT